MTQTKLPPETVTVHIPFRIVKRGGRKEMFLPTGMLDANPSGSLGHAKLNDLDALKESGLL